MLFSDTENQYEKFKKVEDNFNALQSALKEIQSDNHEKVSIRNKKNFFYLNLDLVWGIQLLLITCCMGVGN